MADIDVTIALDHQRYKSQLADVQRSSAKTAATIGQAFRLGVAGIGISTIFSTAKRAVDEYAKSNLEAQAITRNWPSVSQDLGKTFGEDIAESMRYWTQSRKEFQAFVLGLKDRALFNGARIFSNPDGDSFAEWKRAKDAERRSMDEMMHAKRVGDAERQLRAQMDRDRESDRRSAGDNLGADRIEAARKLEERTNAINANKELRPEDRVRLIGLAQDQHGDSLSFATRKAIKEAEEKVKEARRSMTVADAPVGLGGDAFVRDSMFGMNGALPNPVGEAQEKLLRVQEESKDILKQINTKVGKSGPARAG